jgi:hypothetical protein
MIPTLPAVHDAFGRWMAFPSDDGSRPKYDLIDIALAVVVANRMEADPLWLFRVAPPSSGKTEVIRSLGDIGDVFPLSTLTPQTFASGFERKGVETSLLPKISGKTVVMKDFTTILTLHREKRGEILGQLREIYDGAYAKQWGNGKSLDWTGKVGLLAGVTGVIDREYSLGAVLGERFLLYRVKGAPAMTLALRAIEQHATWEQDQRQALRRVVAEYVDELLPVAPPTPAEIRNGIAALAVFTARARSPVFFDARNEIDLIPEPEAPGRLAKQFSLLAQALAVVRQEPEVSLTTYLTVVQVAYDTLPAPRQSVLQAVRAISEPASTTEIGTATDYPTSSARRYLQELAAHKLVTKISEGPGKADRWAPTGDLLDLLANICHPLEALAEGNHLTRSVGVGVMR